MTLKRLGKIPVENFNDKCIELEFLKKQFYDVYVCFALLIETTKCLENSTMLMSNVLRYLFLVATQRFVACCICYTAERKNCTISSKILLQFKEYRCCKLTYRKRSITLGSPRERPEREPSWSGC